MAGHRLVALPHHANPKYMEFPCFPLLFPLSTHKTGSSGKVARKYTPPQSCQYTESPNEETKIYMFELGDLSLSFKLCSQETLAKGHRVPMLCALVLALPTFQTLSARHDQNILSKPIPILFFTASRMVSQETHGAQSLVIFLKGERNAGK